MVSQKVEKHVFYVIPAPHVIRDKLQPESSKFIDFWMPVEDPVLSGDQVRHDDFYASVLYLVFSILIY